MRVFHFFPLLINNFRRSGIGVVTGHGAFVYLRKQNKTEKESVDVTQGINEYPH